MTGYTPLTRETIDLQQNDDGTSDAMNLAQGLRAGMCCLLFVIYYKSVCS